MMTLWERPADIVNNSDLRLWTDLLITEGVRAPDSRGERSGPPMTKVFRLQNGARSFFLGIGS